MPLLHIYFDFEGRMNRKSYLLYILLLILMMLPFLIFSFINLQNIKLIIFIMLFLTAATLWPLSAMACKRLHDMGFSGWHTVWIALLPIIDNWIFPNLVLSLINVLVLLCMLFWPGQTLDNRHGPVPGAEKVALPVEAP